MPDFFDEDGWLEATYEDRTYVSDYYDDETVGYDPYEGEDDEGEGFSL
ncbi:MAG: hypothetical protein ACRER5_22690 [Pseudomonas sp.]